jgi:hypothetical protein
MDKKILKIQCNILIINNTELAVITDPIRVIGFLGVADFTEHMTTKITDVNLEKKKFKKRKKRKSLFWIFLCK